jgi:xanthine/uracil permease
MKPGKGRLAALALVQWTVACVLVFRFWHPHPVWRIPVAIGMLIGSFLLAAFEVGAVRGLMRRK